ncbi:MAG: M16 family metallopeptidase [Candidatus Paceibacteria bacterium]
MIETHTLNNGTDVTLLDQSGTDAVTILAILPVGSRDETTENLYGVSHFIEHMMLKGTEKRPSSMQISKEMDRLGAEYNAFTSKEYTGYYIKVASKHLPKAVGILSDLVYNSIFDPEEMKKEKSVIVEEINMYEDNPRMDIQNVFERVIYKNSPLQHDIAGTRDSVKKFDRDDVLEYRDQHYQPDNMSIICAGSIQDGKKDLEQQFGSQENKNTDKEDKQASFGPISKDDRYKVKQKDTDQAQLMLGFPAYSIGDNKMPALKILNNILGANMSSRLFVNIREKLGLAYSVRSGLANYSDVGHIYIKAGLDSENLDKAIEEIKDTLRRIKTDGVEQKEFEDAKMNIDGKMKLKMEDSKSKAMWVGRRGVILGEFEAPEKYLEQIKDTDKQEVEQVARDLFDFDEMRMAAIGEIEAEAIEKHL